MALPSLKNGPLAITVQTVIPAVAPSDPTLADSVFSVDGGNAIEIFGHCSANNGKLYLFRNLVGTAEWYPVDIDAQDLKALEVDAALPATIMAGLFSGVWLAGDAREGTTGNYVVVCDDTATFDFLYAASRRI